MPTLPSEDPEDILPERWKDLPVEQQKALVLEIKYNWSLWARDNQIVDWSDDSWDILLVLAGRGFGKTRLGAEACREFAHANPGARIAVTAPTLGAARDVCFEGEALALDTEILTARGWTTMGEIQVGDQVYAPDGTLTDVTWKSEVMEGRTCHEVEFFGRQKVVADAGHKWPTLRYQRNNWHDRDEVLTTADVAESTWPRAVPWTAPIQHDEVELPIHPYVLGYWLGDGTSKSAEITTRDDDVLKRIKDVGYSVEHCSWSDNGAAATYSIDPEGHQKWCRETSLHVALKRLGVLRNKHIPDVYLQASEEQRWELLRGLLDSDGDITVRGQVSFGNTNERIMSGFVELAASLGIRVGSISDHGRKYEGCQSQLRVSYTPESSTDRHFWVERKQERVVDAKRTRYNRMQVRPTESVAVRCIGVAHPTNCYLITRRFIVTHNSGLLEVSHPKELDKASGAKYNRSLGQLTYANGSKFMWYSGADPEKFRGPQHHVIWADELCAWEYAQETWDMMLMGLRLGTHPRIIITTTPKPSPLIVELVKRAQQGDGRVKIVTGSTFDNSANLPQSALDALKARYEGTTLGRQELYAELILDSPGALWSREAIEINRVAKDDETLPDMSRIVVAVDPAMSANGDRVAETGIIVAGLGTDGHGYVLEDGTMENATPDQWASKAVALYHTWEADRIVYERNQGGDLIRHTFQTIDDRLPLKPVNASKGKAVRAEPVSALYEQGRCHHVGAYPALEDQLCFWAPNEGNQRTNSPDRLDALVWAFTELMLGGGHGTVAVPWDTKPSDGGMGGGGYGGFAIPRL